MPLKVVAIGGTKSGKTALLYSFCFNRYPFPYVPPLFDIYYTPKITLSSGKEVTLLLNDTNGHPDYHRLRPLMYLQTDLFLLCMDVVNIQGIEEIESQWHEEVKYHCPDVPVILIATKIDLRDDVESLKILNEKGFSPLSYEQGYELSKNIGSAWYMETSAATQKGVLAVFQAAGEIGNRNSRVMKTCFLM